MDKEHRLLYFGKYLGGFNLCRAFLIIPPSYTSTCPKG